MSKENKELYLQNVINKNIHDVAFTQSNDSNGIVIMSIMIYPNLDVVLRKYVKVKHDKLF